MATENTSVAAPPFPVTVGTLHILFALRRLRGIGTERHTFERGVYDSPLKKSRWCHICLCHFFLQVFLKRISHFWLASVAQKGYILLLILTFILIAVFICMPIYIVITISNYITTFEMFSFF